VCKYLCELDDCRMWIPGLPMLNVQFVGSMNAKVGLPCLLTLSKELANR